MFEKNGEVAAKLYTDMSVEEAQAAVDRVNAQIAYYEQIVDISVHPPQDMAGWK